jgi:hypothetical protein
VSPMTNTTTQTAVQFDANWKTILECAAIEGFELMAGVRLELSAAPGGESHGSRTAFPFGAIQARQNR